MSYTVTKMPRSLVFTGLLAVFGTVTNELQLVTKLVTN